MAQCYGIATHMNCGQKNTHSYLHGQSGSALCMPHEQYRIWHNGNFVKKIPAKLINMFGK